MKEIENPNLLLFVVIAGVFIALGWIKWIFPKLGYKPDPNQEPPSPSEAVGPLIHAPFVEEFVDRLLPMVIFYYSGLPKPWWIGYWIWGSIYFGVKHAPPAYRAFAHTFTGLILSVSFYAIECETNIIVAYLCNVLIHFMINFALSIDRGCRTLHHFSFFGTRIVYGHKLNIILLS